MLSSSFLCHAGGKRKQDYILPSSSKSHFPTAGPEAGSVLHHPRAGAVTHHAGGRLKACVKHRGESSNQINS